MEADRYAELIDGKANAIRLKRELRNSKKRIAYKKRQAYLSNLSREDWCAHKEFLLWHRLRKVFTKKEYVSYENLPQELQEQVSPFPEFIIDREGRIESIP